VAIQTSVAEPHWNYLLALDDDLGTLARYIEFAPGNFECYSLELARVLMAAAAECDVIAKQLCERFAPGLRRRQDRRVPAAPTPAHPRVAYVRGRGSALWAEPSPVGRVG
jgi:hypothetical protein